MKDGISFTIGADPEVFMSTHFGKYISLAGKLGGSKIAPIQVEGIAKGFMYQEDNVAAEFNIPPATTADEFATNIHTMLGVLRRKAHNLGLMVNVVPSALFDSDQLETKSALVFGCDADFNAWTGKQNPKPSCSEPRLRTAGGHVHVGTKLPTSMCIRAEDLFLGAPSILMCPDTRRRELYGRAGCYRETVFGHEYRVLSNFWLNRFKTTQWVFHQVHRALSMVSGAIALGVEEEDFLLEDQEAIEKAINERNMKQLDELDHKYHVLRDCPEIQFAIG